MKFLIAVGPVLLAGLCYSNLPDLLQAMALLAYAATVSAVAFSE